VIYIPEDAGIKVSIRAGSVYYFAEETHTHSDEPHYFVVLNVNPLTDEVLILVNGSSQIDNVRRRTFEHKGTLVEVTNEEYPCFTEPISAFNCNDITKRTINELVGKLKRKELKLKPDMPGYVVDRLRCAVLNSPVIERKYKKIISQVQPESISPTVPQSPQPTTRDSKPPPPSQE
jgi:hypothetical protein